MLDRPQNRIQIGLIVAMALAGLWALNELPPDARVPIHFNWQGVADGWTSPARGLFLMPIVAASMLGLQGLLPRLDPRGDNLQRSAGAVASIFAAAAGVLALLQAMIIGGALGAALPGSWIQVALGALFVVMGNVMGKLRFNHLVGIRTPWTLADERVWDQTHRYGGKVFVIGGLLLFAIAAGAPHAGWAAPAGLAVIALCVLVPTLKSYRLWRDLPGRRG
ncbi:MAG: SdpI family protein [Burkholderiales bacterium]|nr:SdpI family protein [Burkholderiales bacterium]MDE1927463.1 SdpI family protein [Burkholderiales bacterium]MDE2159515.1 SdpI family protein [Burkholderiales bacterium]MDE2505108.1 SdpI family protein [Burkholderiales bacterium]